MYAFFGLIITCLAIATHGVPTTHIVGGRDAPIGKFPYQVSLKSKNKYFCGGSIINKRTVLTAAHCIVDDAATITVHAGTNLLSEAGTVYTVERLIIHENFDDYLMTNDIALLILSSNIEYTDLIKPVPLANSDVARVGQPCILSGWGKITPGGMSTDKLQELELKVHDQANCKKKHWQVGPTHICALRSFGQGACYGDSGSPLVSNGIQIGIVSFGRPCATGFPDVFTKIAVFQEWLSTHVVKTD